MQHHIHRCKFLPHGQQHTSSVAIPCLILVLLQINHDVRPDSMLILHAAKEVVQEDGFEDYLNGVRDRIDEIESLHRTRELTVREAIYGTLMRTDDELSVCTVQGCRQG